MRTKLIPLALALALTTACGGNPARVPGPATDPAPGPEAATPSAPSTIERAVVSFGRPSGKSVTTIEPDGTMKVSLVVVQNGRGPKVETTLRVAADGMITSFSANGRHTMGTKIDEHFSLEGGQATWRSEEERGESEVKGPAFYYPLSAFPDGTGLLVKAALATGGTIPLLPTGEARVERVAEITVDAGGDKRSVIGYSITGLDLTPVYTWMNADGSWFGSFSSWQSVVPVGWELVIERVIDLQDDLDRKRDAAIAARHSHRPPAAGLVYTHARVLDVVKGKWLADHSVVVVGDKITAVGPSKKVRAPEGAEVIDLAGKAIVPGLIDMHAHLGTADGVLDIAAGVTTVRDVGNDPDQLDDLKTRFAEGKAIGPRVIRFGFIEGRNPKAASSKVTAETEAEALAAVDFYAARGYEGVKIYNSVRPELVPVITKAAHAKKMKVTGHIPVHMLAHEAVAAGYDGIEHINMLFLNFLATHETDTRDTTRFTLVGDRSHEVDLAGKPVREFLKLLKSKRTVIDPTLGAFEGLFVGEPGKIIPGMEAVMERLPAQTYRAMLIGGLPLDGDKKEKYQATFDKLLAMVKALHASGIPVVVGTDHIAGLMLHHEMELFARAGLTPRDILRIATIDAARILGLDASIGTIARGKIADFAIVDGDPLKTMADIERVESTVRGGVVYPSAELNAEVGVKPARSAAR